jgi:2-polyprenyl-6-methoxyphenol hydroxylase-like FAD-dependent oxidoreductase
MKNNSQEVIIVGSGFAGLISAIMLKNANIPCKLFEANSENETSGDRLTIFTNSMKVLRLVGVADEVITNGFVLEVLKFQDNHGKLMVNRSMGTKSDYGEPTVTIKRSNLHKIILEKAEKLGVEIIYGKKVIGVSENSRSVNLVFEDGTDYSGALVIGCDGINSFVRRTVLNKQISPNYLGLVYFGGFVHNQELIKKLKLEEKTVYVSVGPANFFTYSYLKSRVGSGNDTIHWNCFLSQPERLRKAELDRLQDKEVTERVLNVFARWNNPIEEIIENTSEVWKTSLSDIVEIESWSRGRIIVIGDAAHAMSPLLGQGAGTAMEDAYALARLLEKFDGDYNLAFSELEKLRKPRTTLIAKRARKNSKRTIIEFNNFATKLRNKAFTLINYLTPEKYQNKIQLYDIEKELNKIK